jgi:OOP family OmpA-OmpF porin
VATAPAPAAAPTVSALNLSADAFFDFDKANLKPEGRASLDQLAGEMSSADVQSIDIVGHTDSIGSEAYNQGLSERRAQSAADYLIGRGVNGSLITARGAGELQPIAPNRNPDGSDNPEGRAQNRRVDITVVAQSQ